MANPDYTSLVAGQRAYFHSGATLPVEWRRQQLEATKTLLEDNRSRFFDALRQDLRRNDVDSDLMDVGFCVKEAEYALKHLHSWLKVEHEPQHWDLIFFTGRESVIELAGLGRRRPVRERVHVALRR